MSSKLETRVTALERELASLKEQVENQKQPWWKANLGQFADDPIYDEAMKLGRAYRESLRPAAKRKQTSKSSEGGTTRVRTRHRRTHAG